MGLNLRIFSSYKKTTNDFVFGLVQIANGQKQSSQVSKYVKFIEVANDRFIWIVLILPKLIPSLNLKYILTRID